MKIDSNPPCKHCGSSDIIKDGFVRRVNFDCQVYRCHSCKRRSFKRVEKMLESYEPRDFQTLLPLPNPKEPFAWSDYNEAQMREKLLFLDILEDLCSRLPEDEPKVGRPRASNREMVFCMAAKLYEGLSSRRVSSDLHIAAQRGHIAKVPHFNTVLKYFNDPAMTPFLTGLIQLSSLPLRDFETTFAVDASGLSSAFYSRWFDYRFGRLDKKEEIKVQNWIKIHIICGVKSNIVTSIIVTDGKSNDSPHFPALLKNTAENFKVQEVTADKGYSSRANIDAATEIGAIPYIPFKSNATGTAGGSLAWSKMYHYFQFRREDFMARYHQRSNVESTFSALKRKFSTKLMMKNEVGQVNEALAMLLCYNICS